MVKMWFINKVFFSAHFVTVSKSVSQNEQVQNKSTINSCTDEKAGLATVTILLILTYLGLAIIIIVKVLICWKLNDKKGIIITSAGW